MSLFARHPIRLLLATCWLAAWLLVIPAPLQWLVDFGGFVFLGVTGAIFANATGAGGGVIFIPFFDQLGLSSQASVATSFAIQCCGMTAGAATWWTYFKHVQRDNPQWSPMLSVLALSIPSSLAGIWLVQFVFSLSTEALHLAFGAFSIFLALAIYFSVPLMRKSQFRENLLQIDRIALVLVSFVGGAITAWLSVGVGELVAFYLIIRRYSVTFAIAVAVILTAFSVWGAIGYHAFVSQAIHWQIWFFAGAGAVAGGLIAKRIVLFFSVTHLKVFFATWVLIMGVASLPL